LGQVRIGLFDKFIGGKLAFGERSKYQICHATKPWLPLNFILKIMSGPEKNPYFVQYWNKKGDWWNSGFFDKITVFRCNFQIHEKYDFNILHFTHLFKKNDNCIIFEKMVSPFYGQDMVNFIKS